MRIVVLALVKPTESIINHIKKAYPAGEVEIVNRWEIDGSLFRFIRKQNGSIVRIFYLLCRDLKKSRQVPYFQGLCLLCNAKVKKTIDLNGLEQNISWGSFLIRSIPWILLGIPWGLFILLFNWTVIKLLSNSLIVRLARVNSIRHPLTAKSVVPKCIGFFWSEIPGPFFDFKVGGEISHIVGFFEGLKELGYQGFLVSARPIVHKQFGAFNEVIDEGNLPQWPGEIRQLAHNWKVLFGTKKLIRQWRPSLIYHRTSGFSFIGVLLSILYRIPLVVEINTSVAWKAESMNRSRFSGMLKQTEWICTRYASKVAVVSDEVQNYLVKIGVPSEKIIANPNGVDPNFFTSTGEGKAVVQKYGLSNKIIVGFIGSFYGYHGIVTLARAVRLVTRKIQNIHFLIIGDGKLRPDFEDIIMSDNVSAAVTFIGKVPHEVVPAFLDACDILVSPHQNMEDGSTFFGSPTKIFEYMAMGKGIVASKIGQLEQILQHEKTALLVRPEDPEDLARGIVRLVRDPVLRQTLGQKAREHVVTFYTWAKNVERVIRPVLAK